MFRSNTLYLPFIQILLTVVSAITLIYFYDPYWLAVSVVMYFMIGCLGISIGYHRYLSHRAFVLKHTWMEWPLLWLGCLAGTGSPTGWVAVHREHHRKSDKPGDPHSPHTIGLKSLIAKYQYKWDKWPIRDLILDRNHRFVHDYYFLLLFVWFLFALAQDINLALYGVIIPMCFTIWASTLSNYSTHKFGYVTYKTKDQSKNFWVTAYLTFGEGWHNNHHAHSKNYQIGEKWWELDLGAWIIRNFLKA